MAWLSIFITFAGSVVVALGDMQGSGLLGELCLQRTDVSVIMYISIAEERKVSCMKLLKRGTKLVAFFLSLLMIFSIMPTGYIVAKAESGDYSRTYFAGYFKWDYESRCWRNYKLSTDEVTITAELCRNDEVKEILAQGVDEVRFDLNDSKFSNIVEKNNAFDFEKDDYIKITLQLKNLDNYYFTNTDFQSGASFQTTTITSEYHSKEELREFRDSEGPNIPFAVTPSNVKIYLSTDGERQLCDIKDAQSKFDGDITVSATLDGKNVDITNGLGWDQLKDCSESTPLIITAKAGEDTPYLFPTEDGAGSKELVRQIPWAGYCEDVLFLNYYAENSGGSVTDNGICIDSWNSPALYDTNIGNNFYKYGKSLKDCGAFITLTQNSQNYLTGWKLMAYVIGGDGNGEFIRSFGSTEDLLAFVPTKDVFEKYKDGDWALVVEPQWSKTSHIMIHAGEGQETGYREYIYVENNQQDWSPYLMNEAGVETIPNLTVEQAFIQKLGKFQHNGTLGDPKKWYLYRGTYEDGYKMAKENGQAITFDSYAAVEAYTVKETDGDIVFYAQWDNEEMPSALDGWGQPVLYSHNGVMVFEEVDEFNGDRILSACIDVGWVREKINATSDSAAITQAIDTLVNDFVLPDGFASYRVNIFNGSDIITVDGTSLKKLKNAGYDNVTIDNRNVSGELNLHEYSDGAFRPTAGIIENTDITAALKALKFDGKSVIISVAGMPSEGNVWFAYPDDLFDTQGKQKTCFVYVYKDGKFECAAPSDSYENRNGEGEIVGYGTVMYGIPSSGVYIVLDKPIASSQHKWDEGEITVVADCGKKGEITYSCIVCGETMKEEYEDENPHTYTSKVTKEPTTDSEGVRTYTCSRCGHSYTEVIAKLPQPEESTGENDKKPEKEPEKEPEKNGLTGGTWKQNDGKWWYESSDNSYPSNGWTKIDGEWYAFDASGYMETGWYQSGNDWYYLGTSGAMETGWVADGDTWYYMGESGAMETGWIADGDTWYYMNANGAMGTGWIWDGANWYYMNADGSMSTGWVLDGGYWYYMNASGAMQTGWIWDGANWYYMYSDGSMAHDVVIGGYRLGASGAWVK